MEHLAPSPGLARAAHELGAQPVITNQGVGSTLPASLDASPNALLRGYVVWSRSSTVGPALRFDRRRGL